MTDKEPMQGLSTTAALERRPTQTLWPAVALAVTAALIVELLFATGSALWLGTDSGWYIKLAADIAERGDFSSDLFQFRPPAYPVFLAIVFRLFGSASPIAILACQHAMVAATVLFATLTAAALWPRPMFVLTAGLLCALCPQLSGYANTVLTEAPYACLIAAAVFFLVRAEVTGDGRYLAAASVVAGLCALTRGAGQIAVAVCVCAAIHQGPRARRRAFVLRPRTRLGSAFLRPVVCSALPAAAMILPVMCVNYSRTGHFQLTCSLGVELYGRAVTTDKLGSAGDPALAELGRTLDEAKRLGLVNASATLADHHALLSVYPLVHGGSRTDAAEVMGRAATHLLVENVRDVLRRTAHYAYWMVALPDPTYRVVPGYMPREMFDPYDSRASVERIIGPQVLERYLPARPGPSAISATLAALTSAFRQYVDRGPPILGTGDTLYEELIQVALVGMLIALARRDRAMWLTPAAMFAAHVLVSALLVGPIARYETPVHFLLCIFLALSVTMIYDALRRLAAHNVRAPARAVDDGRGNPFSHQAQVSPGLTAE